jgi:hypothetical protein
LLLRSGYGACTLLCAEILFFPVILYTNALVSKLLVAGNTFKLAAGFKLGYVVSNWEKYVGPDYREGNAALGNEIHITEHELSGISRLRYAAFFRIGYSRIHLSGSYQIAPFFEPNKGVNTGNVVTLGLCFTPF